MRHGRHSQSHPPPPVVSSERVIDVGSRSWGHKPPSVAVVVGGVCDNPEMTVVGIDMTGQVAVTIGWEALRDAFAFPRHPIARGFG